MPIISKGGTGGGSGPAAGTYLPTADAASVTVNTTTYDNEVTGSGKLTTLVFPQDTGAFALAISGDAFPRLLIASDPTDIALGLSDGTVSPYFGVGSSGFILGAAGAMNVAGSGRLGISPATSGGQAAQLAQVSPAFTKTSGALSTVNLSDGAAHQVSVSGDVETHTPATFNPGVATPATCKVELSPDGVTFTTLTVWTVPVGTVFDGTILDVTCRVPLGWRIKLTASLNVTLDTTTYF